MKFSTILAVTIASVAAGPCDLAVLTEKFAPVLTSSSYPLCSADTGYQLASLLTGPLPTTTQAAALVKSDNCQTLYTGTLQKVAGGVTPSCTLGGVELSVIAVTPMDKALAALAAAAAPAAAIPVCDSAVLTAKFAPVLASPSYPLCSADTGYQLASLITGPLPTSTQAAALVKSDNCQTLYTGTLQKHARHDAHGQGTRCFGGCGGGSCDG
ncbi:hypothetical protein SDRG_01972 [Saprolegnia diclina VS20]|uniref:Secreted protein n=1 Tax=Saprolegnia diclina (strain VS20) TaxID=1156394 RepID=T0SDA5_SAPDV|nr:hypothetical protein SDRG_01972 [Saprolegnia diclina VS20]EQC40907.1 hypothetical protein SDRG_01972 [Saprolegnia diclina VS20]|eukprot:XP_008605751.1 hypothetical protein SDRG_01972 [Saprolegnia diclina VS20]